jgi:hypothetical protein
LDSFPDGAKIRTRFAALFFIGIPLAAKLGK